VLLCGFGAFLQLHTTVINAEVTSELLHTNEEIIVQSDDGLGIITPKDIMELFASSPKEHVYVQITGVQDEQIEFKVKMDQAVTDFVQKVGKMLSNIEYLVVHVEKSHKQGTKQRYSMRARFKSPLGFFVANSWGWRPVDVIQDLFKKLEREVVRKHKKISDVSRARRQKRRYR